VWVDVSGDATVVRVQVSDQGPGVPAGLRDAIFERGARGAGSAGEGIGLHVARALVHDLGGSLELAPTAGRGATFVVALPTAEVAPASMQVVA
jgi:signal transduction histidine kinase